MVKKVLLMSLGLLSGLMMCSCSISDDSVNAESGRQHFRGYLNLSVDETIVTRAYVNSVDRKVVWEEGDIVGVFATSGPQQSQVEFKVERVLSGGSGCDFTEGSYRFANGCEFVSYFPLQEKFLRYTSDIPQSLSGQVQEENGSTDGLTPFQFSIAGESIPEGGSVFTFSYDRFWALAYTDFTMPKAGTWTKFTLKAPESKYFHENIKYNFSKEGGAGITDADNVSSVTLTLGEDGTGITTAAGEHLSLFMFICPTDMSGEDLIAEVQDDNGIVYSCIISGMNGSTPRSFFSSNTNYKLSGSLEKSGNIDDVKGTGSNFNAMRQE